MTIRYYIVCRDRVSRTVSKSDLTDSWLRSTMRTLRTIAPPSSIANATC
jgi:hypothetical protein